MTGSGTPAAPAPRNGAFARTASDALGVISVAGRGALFAAIVGGPFLLLAQAARGGSRGGSGAARRGACSRARSALRDAIAPDAGERPGQHREQPREHEPPGRPGRRPAARGSSCRTCRVGRPCRARSRSRQAAPRPAAVEHERAPHAHAEEIRQAEDDGERRRRPVSAQACPQGASCVAAGGAPCPSSGCGLCAPQPLRRRWCRRPRSPSVQRASRACRRRASGVAARRRRTRASRCRPGSCRRLECRRRTRACCPKPEMSTEALSRTRRPIGGASHWSVARVVASREDGRVRGPAR